MPARHRQHSFELDQNDPMSRSWHQDEVGVEGRADEEELGELVDDDLWRRSR